MNNDEQLKTLLTAAAAENIPTQGKHPCPTFRTGYYPMTASDGQPYFIIKDYETAKRLAWRVAAMVAPKLRAWTCPHDSGFYVEIR